MSQIQVLAKIKTKFDLGYIVVLEGGGEAQLRVLEQKGRELKNHVAGTEELIYGEKIPVYIIYQDQRNCYVSQLSSSERDHREEIKEKKSRAREDCNFGNIYTVEIRKSQKWGYLCSEVDGYLSGAIKKPTSHLDIGQKVVAIVVDKNKLGAPYFEIHENLSNV